MVSDSRYTGPPYIFGNFKSCTLFTEGYINYINHQSTLSQQQKYLISQLLEELLSKIPDSPLIFRSRIGLYSYRGETIV